MDLLEEVGEFFHINGGYWRTPNLISLQLGSWYHSPRFESKQNLWQLSLLPRAFNLNLDLNYEIRLNHLQGTFIADKIRIGIAGDDGEFLTCEEFYRPYQFPLVHHLKLCFATVNKANNEGSVCIFLKMNSSNIFPTESFKTSLSEIKIEKEKCYGRNSIACSEASAQTDGEIVKEKSCEKTTVACSEASTQTEDEIETNIIKALPYKDINNLDLKIYDQEIKCPRCILAAGSPTFNALIMQETAKNNTSVLDIPDVSVSIFLDFLNYLRTGNIEILSENVLELYNIADQFQVNVLKKVCKDYILKNISVENFCDVFIASLLHGDIEITDACTLFFAQKALDIAFTSKWKLFVKENQSASKELHVKRLEINKLHENCLV